MKTKYFLAEGSKTVNSILEILALLMAISIGTSCGLDNKLTGEAADGSSLDRSVSIQNSGADIGNMAVSFTFILNYQNVEVVDLKASHLNLSYLGGVTCGTPVISNETSLTPSISVTGCSGNGGFQLVLLPGAGVTSAFQDSGGTSATIVIDNTAPTLSVGSPSPANGDINATFTFDLIFDQAEQINLLASHITVNGSSCDTPVITGGSSSTPSVSLSNCIELTTVGISVQAAAATDAAGNSGEGSTTSATAELASLCPTDYILVPALSTYTLTDFCVMKYEAKALIPTDGDLIHPYGCDDDTDRDNAGSGTCTPAVDNWVNTLGEAATPVSSPEGLPWREIGPGEALLECQSINSELSPGDIAADVNNDGTYDLITNDEWQSMARDIESWAVNWSSLIIGMGAINTGHSNSIPPQPLAASSDNASACVNTNQAIASGTDDSCIGGWNLQKRTHQFSNSEVIWDMSGNAWEWVKDTNTNMYSSDAFLSVILSNHSPAYSLGNGTTTTARTAKDQFGPLGDYSATLNSGSYGGLGYMFSNSDGHVARGGGVATNAGVFATTMDFSNLASNNYISFRCAYHFP